MQHDSPFTRCEEQARRQCHCHGWSPERCESDIVRLILVVLWCVFCSLLHCFCSQGTPPWHINPGMIRWKVLPGPNCAHWQPICRCLCGETRDSLMFHACSTHVPLAFEGQSLSGLASALLSSAKCTKIPRGWQCNNTSRDITGLLARSSAVLG